MSEIEPDAVHVHRATLFLNAWNKAAGLDDLPSEPEITRQFLQFLATEFARIDAWHKEVEDRIWNSAIRRVICELQNMKIEDAQRLARRIRALKEPTPKRSTT